MFEAKGIDPAAKYESDPEGHPELMQPIPPKGFSYRDIWYDLSPMRPDEFGRQSAVKWERAEQIKAAFEKGRRLEQGRRQREREREAETAKRLEKLKHGG